MASEGRKRISSIHQMIRKNKSSGEQHKRCPKTGKVIPNNRKYRWLILVFPIVGLVSLIWFLIRVLPKPSRATYPCQRVAAPLASGFIIWITGLIASTLAFRKARRLLHQTRYIIAAMCLFSAIAAIWMSASLTSENATIAAEPHPVNAPIGIAKGVKPGRVAWIHDPNATDWNYISRNQTEHWYEHDHTNQAVVNRMMSTAIHALADEQTDVAAWDAIFRHFNQQRGKGDVGYIPGEKIGIKVNHTLSYNANQATMDKRSNLMNYIGNSPQLTIAFLRQLIDVVGVAPGDISIGDPGRIMPNYWYDMVEPNCPGVVYIARVGGKGRTQSQWSSVEFNWSDPDSGRWAGVTEQDHIPICFAQADYFINFPVLKSHNSGGITVCAKNNYGSLLRNPDAGDQPNSRNWYNMHDTLPNNIRGMGNYRCLVDLMGHEQLGGKTLLCLVDGLFAGINWDSRPSKWQMEPFNDDWPSSIFLSMDQVALDSVCFDFLYTEWSDYPHISGAQDYLHEAALANNPPSETIYDPENDGIPLESLGVHEHWNNPVDKQYSRNLGTGDGIELYVPSLVTRDGYVHNVRTGKEYDYIRHAISEAEPNDHIVVGPGIYYENINFEGKQLILSSTDPNDPSVVEATIINGGNQAVTFSSGENTDCLIIGFTITDSNTGIYCSGASPTITNCSITGNADAGIKLCNSSNPTIINCRITTNAGSGIEMLKQIEGRNELYNYTTITNCVIAENGQHGITGGIPSITNCTIASNTGCGISSYQPTVTNSIIYYNNTGLDDVQIESDLATVTYTDIQGAWPGEGNIDEEPCFVNIGFWDENGTPEDTNDDFWVQGNYHLQSQTGRWDTNNQTWIQDSVTSPCIDAGSPDSDCSMELSPNGGCINMGAYGGTPQASMSL